MRVGAERAGKLRCAMEWKRAKTNTQKDTRQAPFVAPELSFLARELLERHTDEVLTMLDVSYERRARLDLFGGKDESFTERCLCHHSKLRCAGSRAKRKPRNANGGRDRLATALNRMVSVSFSTRPKQRSKERMTSFKLPGVVVVIGFHGESRFNRATRPKNRMCGGPISR